MACLLRGEFLRWLTFGKHTLSCACLVRKYIVLHNRQKHAVAPQQKRIVLLIEQRTLFNRNAWCFSNGSNIAAAFKGRLIGSTLYIYTSSLSTSPPLLVLSDIFTNPPSLVLLLSSPLLFSFIISSLCPYSPSLSPL